MSFEKINKKIQTKQKTLEALQAELQELTDLKKGKVGELAKQSGLLELDISDKELLAAFKEIAARFQAKPASQQKSISQKSS